MKDMNYHWTKQDKTQQETTSAEPQNAVSLELSEQDLDAVSGGVTPPFVRTVRGTPLGRLNPN